MIYRAMGNFQQIYALFFKVASASFTVKFNEQIKKFGVVENITYFCNEIRLHLSERLRVT